MEEKDDELREITPEDVDKGIEDSVRERRKRETNKVKSRKRKKSQAEDIKVKKKGKKSVYKTIIVDLRKTKLHLDEWGIKLDQQRKSKSRQWTTDMDTIGDVKIDGKSWGKLGIREKIWKTNDPLERRFIMKLFTNNFYWRGTIEHLQGESIMLSYVTNENCPSYLCNIDDSLNLIRIRRLPHKPRFRGEVFGFEITDDDGTHHVFMIDDKRFTLGSDWYVKDIHNRVVAIINGKFLNLGGRFDIEIYDEDLAKTREFYTTLILFASTLRWYNEIRKTVAELIKIISVQDIKLKLDESEADLYLNPRKMNY
ncbi:MAG: hypothetical protein ACTSQE_03400 [Candidatus Heimdallarchaeaceae archaeon]